MFRKIFYIISQRYNPYRFYWFDLLTERHLKNRIGECKDCIECCRYTCCNCKQCYCSHVDIINKRCKIYDKRKCNIWFPISQKEINCRVEIQEDFQCKFNFKK